MREHAPHTGTTGEGDDCRAGTRNRYFPDRVMKASDFSQEQHYLVGRRRLITRAVLGWGVVYGLPVLGPHAERADDAEAGHRGGGGGREGVEQEGGGRPRCPDAAAIRVGPGLAFDRHGREVQVVAEQALDVANTFLLQEGASGCQAASLDKAESGRYLLAVHYAERRFGDAKLPDVCTCDRPEKKYVCETAVFSLHPLGADRCPCGEGPCSRSCACRGGQDPCRGGRGPHACLCDWVSEREMDGEAVLCEWRGYRLDPADAVPLACLVIEVRAGKCGTEIVGCVEDDCSPRRLVKNNDLLYDLVRGCDLGRIEWTSWMEWHLSEKQMSWREFASHFKLVSQQDQDKGQDGQEKGWTDFVVRFSRPVLNRTLKRHVITMAAVTTEQATGWRVSRLVPIVGLDLDPDPEHLDQELPPGTTNQMRVLVRPEWVRDEIERGRESWLSERAFRIHIEIYGDFILDCSGQSIDANPVGRRPAPTGNGTPGGTYRSSFRVERKRARHDLA